MKSSSSIRTTLKAARGLGSSHDGTHHFWLERISALALIPLSIWFVIELVGLLIGGDRSVLSTWIQNPLSALLMAAFTFLLFFHSKLGIQVIIEDYVHHEGKKLATLLVSSAAHYLFGFAALASIARLHFIGI